MSPTLELQAWPTPNGKKIFIMLEELGVPYRTRFVDIDQKEQFELDFLATSPNNKIPAIVDHQADGGPLTIFESGAILTYLADRHADSWRGRATLAGGRRNGFIGRTPGWVR